MAELQPGSKVAKDLGIYLGQLYGWVKAGKVKNHKPDGKYVVEGGKGLIVDPDEARAAWSSSKKKGPRDPSKAARSTGRVKGETVEAKQARTKGLRTGTIVSYETGRNADGTKLGVPRYKVKQIVGANGRITFLDEGGRKMGSFSVVQIDQTVMLTERLATMLARGAAKIEKPVELLGMLILAFVTEGKVELAQSLEDWMIAEGLEVRIPEIVDMPEDDSYEESQPVQDEELSGEE